MSKSDRKNNSSVILSKYLTILIIAVSTFFALVIYFSIKWEKANTLKLAKESANGRINKDIIYRTWVNQHGGVYVKVSDMAQPNPYLNVPNREIISQDSTVFTLVNPAYMTKQVHHLDSIHNNLYYNITSLNPINPNNKADEWETKALLLFETGVEEYGSIVEIKEKEYYRYMRPLKVEQACLQCHHEQGYKVGDIRGGISTTVPLTEYRTVEQANNKRLISLIGLMYIFSFGLIVWSFNKLTKDRKKLTQTQHKLLESKKTYKDITLNSPDVFMRYDSHIRYLFASDKISELTGIDAQDFIGKTHKDLGFEKRMCDFWDSKVKQVFDSQKPLETHFLFNLNYKRIYFDWRLFPEFNENKEIVSVLGIARDITNEKIAEIQLQEKEKQLQMVFDSSTDYIGLFNVIDENQDIYAIEILNKTFIDANKKAGIHFDIDSVRGLDVRKFLLETVQSPQEKVNLLMKKYRMAMEVGESIKYEEKTDLPDGTEMYTQTTLTPVVEAQGLIRKLLYMATDITERKAHEIELKKAIKKAKESDSLKSAFLANMSHEIRTPMNGIIGFSEMLSKTDLSEENRKYYTNVIIDSSKQLLHIVSDVIDISKLQTGQIDINKDFFNINMTIVELESAFRVKCSSKKLNLKSYVELENQNCSIKADEKRIKQILNNLLSNAIKFTKKGNIDFGYAVKGNELEFFVRDTGIGIKPELHESIFEMFRQGELDLTRRYGGTGLGLSISNKLIELMGGKMWLDSVPEEGSTFYFSVPLELQKQELETETVALETQALNTDTDEVFTVLIAEDEEVNFLFYQELLDREDVKLVRAHNGKEAVDICKCNNEIQLILMDMKMPIMNGEDATMAIRKFNPDIPIVAQTAYALVQEHDRFEEIGCNEVLSKPIMVEDISRVFNKYLGITVT